MRLPNMNATRVRVTQTTSTDEMMRRLWPNLLIGGAVALAEPEGKRMELKQTIEWRAPDGTEAVLTLPYGEGTLTTFAGPNDPDGGRAFQPMAFDERWASALDPESEFYVALRCGLDWRHRDDPQHLWRGGVKIVIENPDNGEQCVVQLVDRSPAGVVDSSFATLRALGAKNGQRVRIGFPPDQAIPIGPVRDHAQ